MPKSKQRKNHKQKLNARKTKVQENKAKMEKIQREMIMKLIEKEQEQGMFNNLPQINAEEGLNIEGPTI